ncbi:MAG: DNA-directed DNA polymerase [Candidatus Nanoarchaeia archaeon]|nr:DNA-directed DNA polymerase [Candidatus Nanoarchaeia archaeon]
MEEKKMIFNGIIHKINPINHSNNTYIELLCQDTNGKKIKIVDKSYSPYFRIILNDDNNKILNNNNDNDINNKSKTELINESNIEYESENKKENTKEEINKEIEKDETKESEKFIEEFIEKINTKLENILSKAQITKIEKEENKKYFSKNVKTLKVYYNDYTKTKEIVEEIEKELKNYKNLKEIVEDDLYIGLKYMVDKQLLYNHDIELEIKDYTTISQTIFAKNLKKNNMKDLNTNFYNKICAFDIETEMTTKEINIEKNEIVSISFYNENFNKVLINNKKTNKNIEEISKKNEKLEIFENEKNMLLRFWEIINEYFILIGYNSFNFDIKYIVERSLINEINLENLAIRYKKYENSYKIENILHLDMYQYFRYFLSRGGGLKLDSYSLNNVSKKFLNKSKIEIQTNFILEKMNKEEIEKLIQYNLHDSLLTYELFKKFELSIFDLLNLVALNLEDITKSSSSQIIEAFLIYNGNQDNYLVPRKPTNEVRSFRSTKYTIGAFVFQPEKGLFKDVYVYDFRSLYPSIISAYNICPTTILKSIKGIDEKDYNKVTMEKELELQIGKIYFLNKEKGLIPKNIEKILTERFEIKDQMKKANGLEKEILKARSTSLKIIANSIYGYLGFALSRWYSHDASQAITAYARNLIKQVIEDISNFGCKIIYSDTDSVFFQKNNKSEKEIDEFILNLNKNFKNPIFLEKDGFFDNSLFVGVKKRYAMYSKSKDEFKITGFETIRSDSTQIVRETQKEIINLLLKENNIESAKEYFKKVVEDLRQKKIEKEKLIITYKLSKNVSDYVQNAPHVVLAKSMIEKGMNVKKGLLLKYIIEQGDSNIANRAKLLEDSENYDSEYYINKHLVPSCEDFFSIFNIDISKLISKQNDLSSFW